MLIMIRSAKQHRLQLTTEICSDESWQLLLWTFFDFAALLPFEANVAVVPAFSRVSAFSLLKAGEDYTKYHKHLPHDIFYVR